MYCNQIEDNEMVWDSLSSASGHTNPTFCVCEYAGWPEAALTQTIEAIKEKNKQTTTETWINGSKDRLIDR